MSQFIALPFLTLPDALVVQTPWEFESGTGQWRKLGEHIEDWDPSVRLCLRRTLAVDPETACKHLNLRNGDLKLDVSAVAGTGTGRLPRLRVAMDRKALVPLAPEALLELEIDGGDLTLVLDIHTEITLSEQPLTPGELAPSSRRDRVWSDRVRARLEGEDPRFPMEKADLAKLTRNDALAAAPWFLHWYPSAWNRDFHGAVRLYLNEARPEVIERIESEDLPTLQILLADIMSQVCSGLLLEEDPQALVEGSGSESLAGQAAKWLNQGWPGRDLAFVREVFDQKPGEFRAILSSVAAIRDDQ